MDKEINPLPAQADFITSKARFPALVAGWGYGKTLALILKALIDSENYADNLGLVVRKEYTDLKDSTMRDFERYTGLTIGTDKNVVIVNPDTGAKSTIMFRHGRELDVLQNVNLGWAVIEQAEEFDTDEQFQMLRGRTRREGVPHWVAISGNKRGHNWIWKIWTKKDVKPPSEEAILSIMKDSGLSREDVLTAFDPAQYQLWEATSYDNPHLPPDFIRDIARMKIESPRKYNRFVMNSDEEEIEGTIYGRELELLVKQGRFCNVPYDSSYPVYTSSDLGIDDPTAIWFMQCIGKEIRWIDYYEANNEPLAHYWKVLSNKLYAYGKHYWPFDAGHRSLITATTYADEARIIGWKGEVLPRVDILPGIDFVRAVLGQSWFDAVKCRVGFESLQAYRWVKNERMSTEEHPVYHDEPIHDYSSHPADAMRYASYVIQLHRESLYRPRQFEYPKDYRKPMVAQNKFFSIRR
jgi:hypothetical protein